MGGEKSTSISTFTVSYSLGYLAKTVQILQILLLINFCLTSVFFFFSQDSSGTTRTR